MKLIGAADTENPTHFLIGPDDFDMWAEERDPMTTVRIINTTEGIIHPPLPLGSVTAHMPYLAPYDAEDGELESILDQVEPAEDAPPKDELGPGRINGSARTPPSRSEYRC